MTPNETYGLQPLADVQRAVVQSGRETWAETIHGQLNGGHLSPDKGNRELKLRSMFKAIRALDLGDDRQKKKAHELARFLELTWGLQKAYVTAAEGDIDAMRVLRDAWGDGQLPPVYPQTLADPFDLRRTSPGEFVHGLPADEAVIDAIVRRLK